MLNFVRNLFLKAMLAAIAVIGAVGALQAPSFNSMAQATTVIEQPPLSWGKDSSGLALTNEYFTTQSNYAESRGTTISLPAQNSYSTLTTHAKGRYGLSQKYSVFGGIGFGYAKAVDPFSSRTNSSMTDISVGFDMILLKKWLRVIPEMQVGYPIDRIDSSQTTVLTSEGQIYLRAGLYYFKTFRYLKLGGYSGFFVPDQTAKRFDYEATADFPLGRYFFAGLGLDGYESIIPDGQS